MQVEKWENKLDEDNFDSEGQESESCDELDEVLELRRNKAKRPAMTVDVESEVDDRRVVLTQRLHREPTTRTKRAQRMHEAYRRSMGLGTHTPETAGYVRKLGQNGRPHWSIRK